MSHHFPSLDDFAKKWGDFLGDMSKQGELPPRGACAGSERPDEHELTIFGIAQKEQCLILTCAKCTAVGTVDDLSDEELCDADHSPSEGWSESWRVAMHPEIASTANKG
jgi:hypothetical protein